MADTIVQGAAEVIALLAKDIVLFLKDKGQRELDKLSVDLETGFKKFLDRNYRQYSKIKTLLNSAGPISLESAFESPFLSIDDNKIDEDSFISSVEDGNFFIITGMGGAGKSIFLKHIFIRYYNEARGRVPFLVELRNLPKGTSLISYMHNQLKTVCPKFDETLFECAMRSGKFLFLFDGFDEVDHSIRKDVAEQIISITYTYGDNLFIVSSRPDDTFQSWTEFYVAEMLGFSKSQVLSLIKKVKYDKKVKAALIKLIKERGLYETHSSYLSNPLLCNIMILTFDQGAEIPTKMHLFFSQTYDVLFYRHDATKGTAFRRKFLTSLSIDDYRKALSAFSAFSYIDYGPSLKKSNAVAVAGKALSFYRFDQKPDDFLGDLCSSISLLIKEGDIYSYVHRSFQEYFFALFLSTNEIDGWDSIIERIIIEKPNDSVLQLLSDIDRDRFEREFLSSRVEGLCSDLKKIDISKTPGKAFLLFFLSVSASTDERSNGISSWLVGLGDKRPKWHYMTRFLRDEECGKHLLGFDWRSYIEQFEHGPDHGTHGVRLVNVYDETFLDTPMVNYLEALKTSALKLDSEIKSRINTQKELLSETLFRKKKRNAGK